jgi:hypothetical protein
MKRYFLSILFIVIINISQAQNIEISGNNVVIAGNGSNIPVAVDGTDFDEVVIGNSISHSFSILNLELRNPGIQVQSITVSSAEFIITNNIHHLAPGESGVFDITFQPTSNGIHDAVISIVVKRRGNRITYNFNITGDGTRDIMITQYYENGNADKIEVKNISDNIIQNNNYYLGVYSNGTDTLGTPDFIFSIGSVNPEEVKLIGNSNFLNGNENVVISTSNGINCFLDRVEIIGDNTTTWGTDTSFTKGGCASEIPHLIFDITNWIEVPTAKVDAADIKQNISLGTYYTGPISWDGSSWSDSSLPDLSRIVNIDGIYTANSGNIEACNLIINSDLNFDIGTINSVVVYRDLTINGSFTIGDKESLVMYDDDALITGNISKNESSTYRNNTYDFTYWSSPIADADISNVFAGVTPNRIYLYDQSQTSTSDPNHPDFWKTWVLASGTMIQGKGYAAEGLTGTTGIHDIIFTGKPNNGVINDFNFIGNPYPSAIDIELFFDANQAVIDPTIYLWTHNTPISNGNSGDFAFDDYATYNYTGGTGAGNGPVPEKNIGSSQGFFIRALSSANVLFNNSMRMEDSNNQFYKIVSDKKSTAVNEEKDRIWLNLTTNNGGFNQLLVGFMENATDSTDTGYDALKFEGGNSISFYSLIENKKFTIQGKGPFSQDKTVTLGFDSRVAPRDFSISIHKTEGNLKNNEVYLVDHELNITHDLNRSDYHFELAETGSHPNRFTLQFSNTTTLAVDDIILKDEFIISSKNDQINIRSKKMVKAIMIYDMLGRVLLNTNPDKKDFNLKSDMLKKGNVVVIRAELDNGSVVNKKIIPY